MLPETGNHLRFNLKMAFGSLFGTNQSRKTNETLYVENNEEGFWHLGQSTTKIHENHLQSKINIILIV